jgi:hypothetical protein
MTRAGPAGAVAVAADGRCLGLELTDQGFDFSVLSGFRTRLVAGGARRLPLEPLLARLKEAGLVMPGMRQRTDSTHVLARVRNLNRLELAGEAVRAAVEALAAASLSGWPGSSTAGARRGSSSGLPTPGHPTTVKPLAIW